VKKSLNKEGRRKKKEKKNSKKVFCAKGFLFF